MNVLDSRCSVLTSLVSVAPPESSAKSGDVAPPNLSTRYILNLIRSYIYIYIYYYCVCCIVLHIILYIIMSLWMSY